MAYDHAAFVRLRWAICLGLCALATLLRNGVANFDLFPFIYGVGLFSVGLMFLWYVSASVIRGLLGVLPARASRSGPFGAAILSEALCLLATLIVVTVLCFASSGPGSSMSVAGQEIVANGRLTEAGLRFQIGAYIGQVLTLAAISLLSSAGLVILASPPETPGGA